MSKNVIFEKNTIITIFGASGDLAKKKTFPALFGLFREGYLDKSTKIIGYARSQLTIDDLKTRIKQYLKKPNGTQDDEKEEEFFKMLSYVSGPYDTDEGFDTLNALVQTFESDAKVEIPHRLFYLALPPNVFLDVAQQIKKCVYSEEGITRIIVEKPFGHDLESSRNLQNSLSPLFKEEELFRIDHYLGKELVKNIIQMRFSNTLLNASWNKENLQSIQISFKEAFGTEGRGGYFDSIGIIRDVMQNHLLQILTLLTMDTPRSFDSEAVRDEKVKILKAIKPLNRNDIVIGQYGQSEDGTNSAYLDDPTVQANSKCVTYAAIAFNIDNEEWRDVPIIMRAGKSLNDSKVEIRLQYKSVENGVFKDIPNNELVIRVQPNPSVYMKFNAKTPGLSNATQITDLNLTYSSRYQNFWIPEAYEALIRDALLGDHSNFVRDDELDVSWKLFTPLLHYLEGPDAPQPEIYPYGSRGPKSLREYLVRHKCFDQLDHPYTWPITRPE
ncbi:uncharacterized protein NDAI_0H04010 [Naumovozyma dairenensis CBS 421]|uniref:Glucose-6-phosphate 1-dehydrogenase n=1 Tax=Naumovozyma dairenensis (strain ATCC 10597 / BCRC 20456 / CBS 421 / NBRC 0211 / NRRL Y-12639) TaxID=1071378 RepID=G0WFL3_NAUDC|nr:hypothetical protein NDAI_0H04010 [Naumovozyma dairenensis CBS 421]CCD26574.1 hypothetical protein NDAI_0H04010 [Naumovozyma dairenensis CBS 421]